MNRITAASVILLLSSVGVVAETTTPATAPATNAHPQPMHDICKSDVQKYCKGVQPGMGRIAFCLFDNIAHLSPDCHGFVQHFYDIDTNLAARAHKPLKEFLLEAYARRAHNELVRQQHAQAAKTGTPSSSNPPASPASQPAPK